MKSLTKRVLRIAFVLLLFLVAYACNEQTLAPTNDRLASQVPTGPQTILGEVGPGSLYGLYLPANWNGDLVVFAHGFTQPTVPVALPDVYGSAPTRDSLLAMGFGVAWSSYSENGMALKDGAIRTAQLRNLFTAKFGRPQRTYLWGVSLGGAVVMHLAETNPESYDGVFVLAGIVGGLPYQLNYYYNVRVLFDYFYPGVIVGSVTDPQGMNTAAVSAAILANPAPAMELANIAQTRMSYASMPELVQSIVFALTFQTATWFTGDLNARTHDRSFFDNSTIQYTGSSDDDALNAGVARFTASRDAANLVEQWYNPTGKLRVPVLALHAQRDPVVPMTHHGAYAALATHNGTNDMFVSRVVDIFGHGAPLAMQLAAFRDLVAWVENGVHP